MVISSKIYSISTYYEFIFVKTSVSSYLLPCGRLKVKDSEGQNPAGVVVPFTGFQVPKFFQRPLFVCLFIYLF